MTKKRVLLGLLAVVVVAVVVVTALGRGRGDDGLPVEVAAVDRSTVVQTVTATGKIQPMVQVNISADVSAKIIRLGVDEGDWVEKGALLVELDRERYLAEVESQEANLSAAQAQANLARENMVKAEKDFERSRQLFDRSLESQAALDTMYAVGRGREGALSISAGPGGAGQGRRPAVAGCPVQDHHLRADGGDDLRAQQGGRRDRTRVAVPGGRDHGGLQPAGDGGAGRRRRERHCHGVGRGQGRDRGGCAAGREVQGRGDGDRLQREGVRARDRRPEDRVRGQDRHHRSGDAAAARA